MIINLPFLLLILIIMTWFGAFGGYLLKKASSYDFKAEKFELLKWLIIGVIFYGSAAILNIIALHYLPYTIVFPLTAVTYIWTMLLSYFLLKEHISKRKLTGVSFIILGAIILVL